jgi:COP9 signalosome complex subunit 5
VVIDPNRTVSAGKVEIGAFRTYPEVRPSLFVRLIAMSDDQGYKGDTSMGDAQSIPMDKIEDFGVHAAQYYSLKVEIYKTKTDEKLLELLWNKYWVATLSQSLILSVSASLAHNMSDFPLIIQNRSYATDQVEDLNLKIKAASTNLQPRTGAHFKLVEDLSGGDTKGKSSVPVKRLEEEETDLSKVARDRFVHPTFETGLV